MNVQNLIDHFAEEIRVFTAESTVRGMNETAEELPSVLAYLTRKATAQTIDDDVFTIVDVLLANTLGHWDQTNANFISEISGSLYHVWQEHLWA